MVPKPVPEPVGVRKMREKLQVNHMPTHLSKEQIAKVMSIFGPVTNVELIADAHLKKFAVAHASIEVGPMLRRVW